MRSAAGRRGAAVVDLWRKRALLQLLLLGIFLPRCVALNGPRPRQLLDTATPSGSCEVKSCGAACSCSARASTWACTVASWLWALCCLNTVWPLMSMCCSSTALCTTVIIVSVTSYPIFLPNTPNNCVQLVR